MANIPRGLGVNTAEDLRATTAARDHPVSTANTAGDLQVPINIDREDRLLHNMATLDTTLLLVLAKAKLR